VTVFWVLAHCREVYRLSDVLAASIIRVIALMMEAATQKATIFNNKTLQALNGHM
jgi:hypothetical protein